MAHRKNVPSRFDSLSSARGNLKDRILHRTPGVLKRLAEKDASQKQTSMVYGEAKELLRVTKSPGVRELLAASSAENMRELIRVAGPTNLGNLLNEVGSGKSVGEYAKHGGLDASELLNTLGPRPVGALIKRAGSGKLVGQFVRGARADLSAEFLKSAGSKYAGAMLRMGGADATSRAINYSNGKFFGELLLGIGPEKTCELIRATGSGHMIGPGRFLGELLTGAGSGRTITKLVRLTSPEKVGTLVRYSGSGVIIGEITSVAGVEVTAELIKSLDLGDISRFIKISGQSSISGEFLRETASGSLAGEFIKKLGPVNAGKLLREIRSDVGSAGAFGNFLGSVGTEKAVLVLKSVKLNTIKEVLKKEKDPSNYASIFKSIMRNKSKKSNSN
jgi:hypothetical protein